MTVPPREFRRLSPAAPPMVGSASATTLPLAAGLSGAFTSALARGFTGSFTGAFTGAFTGPIISIDAATRAFTGALAITVLLLTGAAPASAQEDLPTAAQILERYHDAIRAADFAAVQSLHSIGEISIPLAGIRGTLETWQARPNRTLMYASVPGFGEVRTGFTGSNGWSVDPTDGPRVLGGPEAAQAEDDAHFDSHLRTRELVDSMVALERTTLSGHDCYRVRVVWKTGRETTDCYSADTGLLVASVRIHQASTGPAEALILYEDYRSFGDVRLPTRITTRVEDVEQVITLHTVRLNGVPDSAFVPPEAIRKLLGT